MVVALASTLQPQRGHSERFLYEGATWPLGEATDFVDYFEGCGVSHLIFGLTPT